METINSEYFSITKSLLHIKVNPKLDIIEYNDCFDERGIICSAINNEFISENEILFSVPVQSLFNIEAAINTPLNLLFKEVENGNCREDDFLSLLLLYEKYVNNEISKWHKHIEILPKSYHNIANYDENELELIRGTNLYFTALQWKSQINDDFKEFSKCLVTYNLIFEWFTFDEYLWGLSTIWSRFISIQFNNKLRRCMVPVVDLLNHKPNASVGHYYNSLTNTFDVITTQKWYNKDEIYLNYGNLNNSRLLMLYGFCIKENPYSNVEVWASINSTIDNYETKRKALSRLDINDLQEPFIIDNVSLPYKLMTFLRIQHAKVEEMFVLKDLKSIVSIENELEICDSLEYILEDLLPNYNDSLIDAELDEVSDFIPPSNRRLHSLLLVYSEKKCLTNTLELLREYKNNLILK